MKKSVPMGLIFNILRGSLYRTNPGFWKLKIWCILFFKIARNRHLFSLKIPRYGYLFLKKEKLTLIMGMDLELQAAHPRSITIWVYSPWKIITTLTLHLRYYGVLLGEGSFDHQNQCCFMWRKPESLGKTYRDRSRAIQNYRCSHPQSCIWW